MGSHLAVADWERAASLEAGRRWQQRVGAFSSLPELIRQLGAEPDAVLEQAGLTPDAFANPEGRVEFAALVDVLNHAARTTGCLHIGLLAGRLWRLGELGLLGQLVRHSATVGRGLAALATYQHLNSEGALVFLLRRGDFVDFGYAVYHPAVSAAAQM